MVGQRGGFTNPTMYTSLDISTYPPPFSHAINNLQTQIHTIAIQSFSTIILNK